MKIFVILFVVLPSVLGNKKCCMPENFGARTYGVDGPLGNVYVYVDFPSKRITVIPGHTSALKGVELDFGSGTVYKHYYALDQCTHAPFTQLSGFDRCIPDDAQGNATIQDWTYTLPSGMNVKIVLEASNCHPFFFSLSDPSHPDWTQGVTWVGILDDLDLNVAAPYVKTFQCVDQDDLVG